MNGIGIREWIRGRRQALRERRADTGLEVALVALFFLAFLGLLQLFFPTGTGLRSLIRSGDLTGLVADEPESRSRLWDGADRTPTSIPTIGYVAAMRNNVQSRRANSVAWLPASEGMPLHQHDAVQTARDSSASLRVGGKGTLDLGEKSLVVVQRIEKDVARRERRSFLLMVDGELRGRIEGTAGEPVAVNVASAGGVGRIVSRGGKDEATDFRVTVNPDRTTTYAVFEGNADVEGMGQTVRVGANQYTVVSPEAPPTAPRALPDAPELAGPADGAAFPYRTFPSRVLFSWKATEPAEAYRLVLASDAAFRERIVDAWVTEPSFTHGNLPAGIYYWRVSASRGGVESGYPKARVVRIVQSVTPPPLKAEAAPVPGSGDRCIVRGSTAPGASLLVGGTPVSQGEDGAFECIVPLQRGINRIVMEASDAVGNTAYHSLRVIGKF